MAENVGGADIFGSGGHVWAWSEPQQSQKVLTAVGTYGATRMVLQDGARACLIQGREGGPAVLKASSAASRAAADAALTAIEDVIEACAQSGAQYSWEDDHGHTGTELVVAAYTRVGPRKYGREGTDWKVWQFYRATILDLSGQFD